jgi:hypothetical protein
MKTILLLTAIIFTAAARADEQVISTFSWKELADAGKLTAGTPTGAPDNALKVENRGPGAMSATVLTIVQPKITTDFYAVTGEVRYDNVEGDGFLEMWSHFGETAAYFSRTLGVAGPMAKLTGTSDWRAFTLPFNAKGASSRPSKLLVNVQLPGKGRVFLRNLKFVQSTSFDGAATQTGAWWSDRTADDVDGRDSTMSRSHARCKRPTQNSENPYSDGSSHQQIPSGIHDGGRLFRRVHFAGNQDRRRAV